MKISNALRLDDDGTFAGFYFEDCCLLSLKFDEMKSKLTLEIDFSIWPDSIYYLTPKPNEWTCYRKGQINFIGIKQIDGLIDLADYEPTIDVTGEKDWGNIYGFRKEGEQIKFEICDREVSLVADEIEIIIH